MTKSISYHHFVYREICIYIVLSDLSAAVFIIFNHIALFFILYVLFVDFRKPKDKIITFY